MDKHYLQAEVAALLRQSQLNKADSVSLLDAVLKEVFFSPMHRACCPSCETVFQVSEASIEYYVKCECPSCHEVSIVVTGTIVSKRSNATAFSPNGLFIRFRDALKRERYIELYNAFCTPELKSKDIFSLCVGERALIKNSWDKDSDGRLSIMNLTINNAPTTGKLEKREMVLEALKGPSN